MILFIRTEKNRKIGGLVTQGAQTWLILLLGLLLLNCLQKLDSDKQLRGRP